MASSGASTAAIGLLLLSGCAWLRPPAPAPVPAPAEGELVGGAELARIRCLLIAPFENTTSLPKLGAVATSALVSSVDPEQTRVFPIEDLRELYDGTPLELPEEGVSPRLAVTLGERVGADGVLYGVVEGRAQGVGGEFLVTLRLQAAGGRELLFATVAAVRPAPGEQVEVAMRKAMLLAARPLFMKMGSPGTRRCFDPELVRRARDRRADRLRARLAEVEGRPPPTPQASPPQVPEGIPPPAVAAAPATPSAAPTPPPASEPQPAPPPAESEPVPPPAPGEPSPPAPAPAAPAAAVAPGGVTAPRVSPTLRLPRKQLGLTARQLDWARHIEGRERFVVDDLEFAGRSAALVTDRGLADLAKALRATSGERIVLEVFVDATDDASADAQISMAMGMAATRRLVALGVGRDRVSVRARGGEAPLMPNFTTRGRSANRRIEVVPAAVE